MNFFDFVTLESLYINFVVGFVVLMFIIFLVWLEFTRRMKKIEKELENLRKKKSIHTH